MNCKPGDLAIVVRSLAGNEGKIVQCDRLATNEDLDSYFFDKKNTPAWIIKTHLRMNNGMYAPCVPDAWLRPIRGQDGEDEMLRIAGYPHKETA